MGLRSHCKSCENTAGRAYRTSTAFKARIPYARPSSSYVKRCARCRIEKTAINFSPDRRSKNGLDSYCKLCKVLLYHVRVSDSQHRTARNERARVRRQDPVHKAKVSQYNRSPVGRAIILRSILHRKYGMSESDYARLLERQRGVCGICGRGPSEIGRRLAVDHNHQTRCVRGLLCNSCNAALGKLGDDLFGVRRAVRYLEACEDVLC